MQKNEKYLIHSNPKFGFLELIDVPNLVASYQGNLINQTLCRVNNSILHIGILQGEFHWQKRNEGDEFFFVLQGKLQIDLKDKTITLGLHQGYTIPGGVKYRTKALVKTVILMIKSSAVESKVVLKYLMENRLKTII